MVPRETPSITHAQTSKEVSEMARDNSLSVYYASYLTYEELTNSLHCLQQQFPKLVKVCSAGKSRQQRELWVATVTNFDTGAAEDKPAMYIDGNHHALEVTGSSVCVYTIAYLASEFGEDENITDLLNTRAFYILPRVSPDGAEICLTTPEYLRSTPRPWPLERLDDGVYPEDIDGDGKILRMRQKEPHGEFKISERDPRLMVRRMPDETGGEYYRVYTEGRLRNFDGIEVKTATSKWGLDLNRNYPINWGGEAKQPGSGPYPLSEPETRAVAEFVAGHKNISAVMSYHTTGGVILRPRCTVPDLDIPAHDLEMYRALGRRGTHFTGYPTKSIFEGFTRDKRKPSIGSFLDFSYDHLGLISFATELWDLNKRAGIPDRDASTWGALSELEEEEDNLKVLKWLDENLGEQGFCNWREFDHPELGAVEIGGVDLKSVFGNPPEKFLREECHKNMLFTLSVAKASPMVQVTPLETRTLGDGVYSIGVVVANVGYMPTSGSQQAVSTKVARSVEASVCLPEGATLVDSRPVIDLGHIPGRALSSGSLSVSGNHKKATWLVDISNCADVDSIDVTVDAYRGGKKRVCCKISR